MLERRQRKGDQSSLMLRKNRRSVCDVYNKEKRTQDRAPRDIQYDRSLIGNGFT